MLHILKLNGEHFEKYFLIFLLKVVSVKKIQENMRISLLDDVIKNLYLVYQLLDFTSNLGFFLFVMVYKFSFLFCIRTVF